MKENKLNLITNLFEGKEIRSVWDSEKEDYYFSVVDVISALTDSPRPRKYWYALKMKLNEEGSELSQKVGQLKMKANEYKEYKGIRKESLRDNMPDIEVVLTYLGEIATRELTKEHKPNTFEENKKYAKLGGNVAKVARDELESKLGKIVITKENNLKYEYDNKKLLNK